MRPNLTNIKDEFKDEPTENNNKKERSSIMKFAGWAFGISLFILVVYGIAKYNTFNESRINNQTADKYAREFVYAMQQENIDYAYQLLTDRSKEKNPVDELRQFAKEDPFQKYDHLEICLLSAGKSESGHKYLDGTGNIYFNGDYVPFQIIMIQDENKVWKINGFVLVRNRAQSRCDIPK